MVFLVMKTHLAMLLAPLIVVAMAPLPTQDHQAVTYGVFGDVAVNTDGTISHEVLVSSVRENGAFLIEVHEDQEVIREELLAINANPKSIVGTWKDHKQKPVVIRNGNQNFGWIHVKKHNVSMRMMQMTTQQPNVGYKVNGTAHTYDASARIFECAWGVCSIKKQITVRVAQDTRLNHGYGDSKPKGVITAYCLNPNQAKKCPNWVRELIG